MAVNRKRGGERPAQASEAGAASAPREPVTRERVLEAAVALADAEGVEALTMRRLGRALGVEAMSLYNHVANKDDVLDGMVGRVTSELGAIQGEDGWRAGLGQRARATYRMLLRHPWASTLIESRKNPIPARTRACDQVLGLLRAGGFSLRAAYHAFLILDSYVYGFALQEVSWPTDKEELPAAIEAYQRVIPAATYPHVAAMMEHVLAERTGAEGPPDDTDYAPEFEVGLELVLEGLERLRSQID